MSSHLQVKNLSHFFLYLNERILCLHRYWTNSSIDPSLPKTNLYGLLHLAQKRTPYRDITPSHPKADQIIPSRLCRISGTLNPQNQFSTTRALKKQVSPRTLADPWSHLYTDFWINTAHVCFTFFFSNGPFCFWFSPPGEETSNCITLMTTLD